jgi:cobalt-zinc-cadmium efflux system outer membrane protein
MVRQLLRIFMLFVLSIVSGVRAIASEAQVPLPPSSETRLAAQSAQPLSTQAIWRPSTLQPIAFQDFVQEVERSNLDLAAQRYNVSIAEAQLVVARVYPNPTFQLGYNGDVSHQNQASNYAAGLSQTILLGGKIGARTDVAQSGIKIANSQLADFFRNLRANAAGAFVDGLTQQLNVERKQRSMETLEQLVKSNTERLRVGDIGEIDLVQSRVALLQARSDLLAAQSALQQTLAGLAVLVGRQQQDGLWSPSGNLEIGRRAFAVADLVKQALGTRSDVLAAQSVLEAAHAQYVLAQANRVPDLTVGLNSGYFTRGTNPIDPTPIWKSLGVNFSIPIPISNLVNQGDLQAALNTELQAKQSLAALELKATTDVRSAYERYTLAADAVAHYSSQLLQDADRVLDAKIYSYNRGAASLLDVLEARRANNDIYLAYYTALSEQAKALIALEQSAGIWDINF